MGRKYYDLWVDISNTPQVLFLKPLISELREYSTFITCWDRGETVELLKSLGFDFVCIGKDSPDPTKKAISVGLRALRLAPMGLDYKALLTLNSMPLLNAFIRRKKSILFADNDVKLINTKTFFSKWENRASKLATYVLVPEAAYDNFLKFYPGDKLIAYPGYKEHISISDYVPDPNFMNYLPFEEYVVVRPESLSSHYVMEKKSIVPELLRLFERENVNVVYLPRNDFERKLADKFGVFIPPKALNGLDLSYYSNAVLTGSGTMAREAALLGIPAISFFPGERLLAVDIDLIEKGKMFHSREPEEILEYVIKNWGKKRVGDFEEAKKVKEQVVQQIKVIIDD